MPLVETLLNRLGLARKADVPIVDRTPTVRVLGGTARTSSSYYWQTIDYYGGVRDGYARNSDVYACVSLIAQTGKQCKWWDGKPGRASKTAEDVLRKMVYSPSQIAFHKAQGRPLPLDPSASVALFKKAGGPMLLDQWISYLLLTGNNYLEIVRDQSGKPDMLFLDRPDRVRANPTGTMIPAGSRPGTVKMWQVELMGGANKLVKPWEAKPDKQATDEEIVHSKLFNPLNDIYGLPPLAAAMLRVVAQNEGGELMAKMFDQGYAPGWIEATREWDEPQVAALRRKVRESKAMGEELFLEGGKWHAMHEGAGGGLDSAIINQQILTKRDIASVFHVDPSLIGDTEGRTYATYRESRQALYMEAVIPLLRQFADDWNRTIGRDLNSPLDFDRDSFDAITAARQEAADRVHKLFTGGLITQGEGREDLEYPPAKSGDVFFAPASMLPLDVTGAGREGDGDAE